MWQIVAMSLIIFGAHQLIISRDATPEGPESTTRPNATTKTIEVVHSDTTTSGPFKDFRPLTNLTTTSVPKAPEPESVMTPKTRGKNAAGKRTSLEADGETNTVTDAFYTFTDPETGKKYEIPKLGDCVPQDGYIRFLNPENGQPEFENPSPMDFRVVRPTLAHYGFTWTGAPTDPGILARISGSEAAAGLREEFNQKIEQLGVSPVTEVDWSELKTDVNQRWPEWPIDTTAAAEASLTVSLQRKMYAFQLVFKCGQFTLYTDQVHWLEVFEGKCDSGEHVFEKCEICWDPTAPCPVLIED